MPGRKASICYYISFSLDITPPLQGKMYAQPPLQGQTIWSAWLTAENRMNWKAVIFIQAKVSYHRQEHDKSVRFRNGISLEKPQETSYLFDLFGYLHQTQDHSLSSYLLLCMLGETRISQPKTREISLSRVSNRTWHPWRSWGKSFR